MYKRQEIFYKYCRESEELKRMFNISYKKALEKTNKITYQSMEAFIHNLNTVNSRAGGHVPLSSVCFGTDTTPAVSYTHLDVYKRQR